MKSYLIIGGAGFIGVNFAGKLLEAGHRVHLFDNFSRSGTIDNFNQLKARFPDVGLTVGDIRYLDQSLASLIETIDIVYLLAAQVAVTTSLLDPVYDFEVNARGTLNVLEAIRISKRRPKLVFASTNKVYGDLELLEIKDTDKGYRFAQQTKGVDENQHISLHSPYGCSKGVAEYYIEDYVRSYNLSACVLRQSCIYGPSQHGVEDQGWVSWFLIAAKHGHPITIFGDGKQSRDLLHVDDLFELWQLGEKHVSTGEFAVFNAGGGKQQRHINQRIHRQNSFLDREKLHASQLR